MEEVAKEEGAEEVVIDFEKLTLEKIKYDNEVKPMILFMNNAYFYRKEMTETEFKTTISLFHRLKYLISELESVNWENLKEIDKLDKFKEGFPNFKHYFDVYDYFKDEYEDATNFLDWLDQIVFKDYLQFVLSTCFYAEEALQKIQRKVILDYYPPPAYFGNYKATLANVDLLLKVNQNERIRLAPTHATNLDTDSEDDEEDKNFDTEIIKPNEFENWLNHFNQKKDQK